MTEAGKQKTIAREIRVSGKGLQTGEEVEIICSPALPETGIVFSRADIDPQNPFRVSDTIAFAKSDRSSTIGINEASIQTVEHFLAALWGIGIDNIFVSVHGVEFPALDGSAVEFIKRLDEAGTKEQEKNRRVINITEPLKVEENNASLSVYPDDTFSVSYLIDYDCPSIGKEEFNIVIDKDTFRKEIAPARTFCLKKEAEALLAAGYGKGANYENTLVMDEDGPIATELRFTNEPVRHKVLDLVGDLYLLGLPVAGKFIAKRSGHSVNTKMVKRIYEKYLGQGEMTG